jgi:hypothetical protein
MKCVFILILITLKCLSIKIPILITPNTTQTDLSVKLSPYLSKIINKLPIINLCIGNPIQCFSLSIDLTLYYTILQDNDIEHKIFNKNFNKNLSNTFKSNNNTFNFFFQNFYITTNIVEDEITLKLNNNDNIQIKNKFPFGLIKTDKKMDKVLIDGFIGLIRNYTLKKENYNETFNLINYIYKSKFPNSNSKIFSLNYKSDNNGNIKGGEFSINENEKYNKFCIINEINNLIAKDEKWFCVIKYISINNKQLNFTYKIYFHSLSPLIKIPREAGMFILINMMKKSNNLCKIISEDNTNNFLICPFDFNTKKFDDIEFHFDNINYYVIRPEFLFEKIHFKGKDILIFKIITFEIEGNDFIIGIPGFIENKIIFDTNNKIGFIPLFISRKEELNILIKNIYIIIIIICILGIINLFYLKLIQNNNYL